MTDERMSGSRVPLYRDGPMVEADGYAMPYYFSRTFAGGAWSAGTTTYVPAYMTTVGGSPVATADTAAPAIGCTVQILSEQNNNNVVGEMHTANNMGGSVFTYGKTADSNFGVGYSFDGTHWSINGTTHVGTSSSSAETWTVPTTVPMNTGHRLLSSFHWQKRKINCPVGGTHYDIVATLWRAGAILGADNSSFDHQCNSTYSANKVPQAPGTKFDRSGNAFVTWSIDASAFGVGLSAQSGASTYVKIHLEFHQSSGNQYICGNDAAPTQAHRIFAGV
jgi:hypothetical protein